ncbi:hypothetical protein [Micromonospora inositola]|uniref:Ferritin-like metal-binding protein YciE n=1 Tax=Micromonospora inositola TaxID=47865 RepID=A0A1C5IP68_9ACTN|nr:hypothetical protein [Micromonospora inositola]SCG60130.1 hypothetical protein GA0070613_3201 [Micromonospora inositola]
MQLAHYLGLLHKAQTRLGDAFTEVGEAHREEPDVFHTCQKLTVQCRRHAEQLEPFSRRYAEDAPAEPDRLHSQLFSGTRTGGIGLLRDLQDLYLMAAECDICWAVVGQAAYGARDEDLLAVVRSCEQETAIQLKWLRTRMKQAAPQALVVAE